MTRTAAPLPTTNTETPSSARPHVNTSARAGDRRVRLLGTLVIVAVLVLGLSGAGTWALVQTDTIATHSMALSAGKTYTPLPLSRHEPASCTEDTHSDPSA